MASLSFAFGCRLGVDRNGMSTRTSPFSGSRIMDNGLRAAIRNNERAATQRRSSWQVCARLSLRLYIGLRLVGGAGFPHMMGRGIDREAEAKGLEGRTTL